MSPPRPRTYRTARWALAIAALTFGACGGDADDSAASLRVATTEMRFTPARLEMKASQDVRVIVDNRGDVDHTFSIDELDIHVKLNSGEREELTVNAAPASYGYVCRILDHAGLGMVGTLVVS